MWAALCERPNPALISASPAAARGVRKIKKRQATVAASVNAGVFMKTTFFPLAESNGIRRPRLVQALPRLRRRRQISRANFGTRRARSKQAPEAIRQLQAR